MERFIADTKNKITFSPIIFKIQYGEIYRIASSMYP